MATVTGSLRTGASPRRKGPSVETLGASEPKPSRRRRPLMQQQRQYVGIDLHRVMARAGVLPADAATFGPAGQALLDQMPFEGAYAIRVESLRDLLELYERELALVTRELHRRLAEDRGYVAIQAIRGVGPIMAAIFVAEIGDVSRFPTARHLCSWAGMTPSHRESDTKVQRGHITKQGNHLVRWAAIEAVARYHGGDPIAPTYMRVARKRGRNIGRVAAAR